MAKVHTLRAEKNTVEFNLDLNAIRIMPFQITAEFCRLTKAKINKRLEQEHLNAAFEGIERPAPVGLARDPDADELGKYLWVVFNMTDCMSNPFSGEPMDFISYLNFPVRAKDADIAKAHRRGHSTKKLVKEWEELYNEAKEQVAFAESFEVVAEYPDKFYDRLDNCIESRWEQIVTDDPSKTAENDADLALLAGLRSQL